MGRLSSVLVLFVFIPTLAASSELDRLAKDAIESALPTANASAGAALVAAVARLTAEQAKMYRSVYKKQPKVLELITLATK